MFAHIWAYAIRPYTGSLNIGRGGDFFASSLMWRAYAIRPYTYSLNHWVGRRISLRVRSCGGRMRYAPTPVRLIIGRGGDIFAPLQFWQFTGNRMVVLIRGMKWHS